jgi:hypothetical protein
MRRQLYTAGFAEEQILAFQEDLAKSGTQSVDAFLEHRREFLEVGKAAIACALVPLEREESFFSENPQNWYEYFFNKLNVRFEEFDKNSVCVLTFNYDRSLEHYLFTALSHKFGKSAEECAEKLRSIPIIHLYGHLGHLPYVSDEGVAFGSVLNPGILKKCAEGIRVIHEDVSGEPQFQEAHQQLRAAERICFLGFGYDKTNLERLAAYSPNPRQERIGSTVGLISREIFFIEQQLKHLGFGDKYSLNTLSLSKDSLEFLRSSCAFDWE